MSVIAVRATVKPKRENSLYLPDNMLLSVIKRDRFKRRMKIIYLMFKDLKKK